FMQFFDDVGAGDTENVGAALEGRTSEIVETQIATLQIRPCGTVKDDDSCGKRVEKATHGMNPIQPVFWLSSLLLVATKRLRENREPGLKVTHRSRHWHRALRRLP